MAELDKAVAADLAHRIMAHISYHSTYIDAPGTFQFALPDGRYLLMSDYLIKPRRILMFASTTPVKRPVRDITASIGRPRKLPQTGPWFVGYTPRQLKRAHKLVQWAASFSYRNVDDRREPSAMLIDPMREPERMQIPDEWIRRDIDGKEIPR